MKNFIKANKLFSLGTLIIFLLSVFILYVYIGTGSKDFLYLLEAILGVYFLSFFIKIFDYIEKKRQSDYVEYLKRKIEFYEDLESNEGNNEVAPVSDKKDIYAAMMDNNNEINEYFTISKSQAKVSYLVSILSCLLGFLLFAISVYTALTKGDKEVIFLNAISGAITEVIAGTVLVVYIKAAKQLNHYYNALHENEKVLLAINLADRIGKDKKDEVYMEIIKKQIERK